jgi:hypothetical protein
MPKGVYLRKPREPKQYDAALVERVRTAYAAGMTQAEIGADEGLTQKIIHTLMSRHGIAARVAAKRNQRGEMNDTWRGDEAGYQAFHRRLYAKHGKPTECAECGTTTAKHYDYANLTGLYADLNDYAPMCRSCHWKYDGRIANITGKKGGMPDVQSA